MFPESVTASHTSVTDTYARLTLQGYTVTQNSPKAPNSLFFKGFYKTGTPSAIVDAQRVEAIQKQKQKSDAIKDISAHPKTRKRALFL
jgi:hypothetical protein